MPWGDVTAKGNNLFLSVFDWPDSGVLCVPGLKTKIKSAQLLNGAESTSLEFKAKEGWTMIALPARAPEKIASVIQLQLAGAPEVDSTWGLDPDHETEIPAEFAEVTGATKSQKRWMEKFGEWKRIIRVHRWGTESKGSATWEVDVVEPGDYNVDLDYAGEGRLVWGVGVEGGEHIQNQQGASHNYQKFPIGWIHFPKAGRYRVAVSLLEGDAKTASLKGIQFSRVK